MYRKIMHDAGAKNLRRFASAKCIVFRYMHTSGVDYPAYTMATHESIKI